MTSTPHADALEDSVDYLMRERVRELETTLGQLRITNARLERDMGARDSQARADYLERERLNGMLDRATAENTVLRQRLARCEHGHHHDGG